MHVDRLTKKLLLCPCSQPSNDLINQPPPISFKSLKKFLVAHRGETKVRIWSSLRPCSLFLTFMFVAASGPRTSRSRQENGQR